MTEHLITELATLEEARQWLRERVEEGERCPCCTQYAKVYRRRIHHSMALALVLIFKAAPMGEWLYLPHVLNGRYRLTADVAKLVYWQLIEADDGQRDDGSNRTGWWRLTEKGRDFVLGAISIPKHARIYDGRLLNLVGDPVTIREIPGFDYAELMVEIHDKPTRLRPLWLARDRPQPRPQPFRLSAIRGAELELCRRAEKGTRRRRTSKGHRIMTDKTDLDYAHDYLESPDDVERASTFALLSIAGSLARLVELTEADAKRSAEWQDRVNEAQSAREASLRAREAEGRSQSAGQPLPEEIVETLVDHHGIPVGTVRSNPEMEDQGGNTDLAGAREADELGSGDLGELFSTSKRTMAMTADHLPLEGQTVTLTLGGVFDGKRLSNAVFRGLATTDKGVVWRVLVNGDTYQIGADMIDDWQAAGPKLKVAEVGDAGYVVVTMFTAEGKRPVLEVHGVTSDAIAAKREASRLRREHRRETSGFGGEGKLEVFIRPILTPAMFGDEPQADEVAS